MDYEKEYKSLVAKVKKAHQFAQTDSTKSVLEDILPQLRESEDERVRMELIEYLRGDLDDITTDDTDRWISWLEKQKDAFENGRQLGIMQEQARQELEWTDEKQKEQNPAEWSEKDENELEIIIGLIEDDKADAVEKYPKCKALHSTYDKMLHFLKSLHPQHQGIYQKIVKGLRDMCDRYERNGVFTDSRARDFLCNVRVKCKDAIECAPFLDEPCWKPSEEQMKALAWYSGNYDIAPTGDKAIKSLYNDLKKLM